MPAKGPVSLVRQTIYCFIPILDLYAAYTVKKLRWYLAIMIIFAIASSSLASIIYPEDDDALSSASYNDRIEQGDWAYLWFGPNPELGITLMVLWWATSYVIAVFLIRRWSKKWNEQQLWN